MYDRNVMWVDEMVLMVRVQAMMGTGTETEIGKVPVLVWGEYRWRDDWMMMTMELVEYRDGHRRRRKG